MRASVRSRLRPSFAGYRDADRPDPSAEVIKTKGMEKIEVEDLVREITPHGRGTLGIPCCCSVVWATSYRLRVGLVSNLRADVRAC